MGEQKDPWGSGRGVSTLHVIACWEKFQRPEKYSVVRSKLHWINYEKLDSGQKYNARVAIYGNEQTSLLKTAFSVADFASIRIMMCIDLRKS